MPTALPTWRSSPAFPSTRRDATCSEKSSYQQNISSTREFTENEIALKPRMPHCFPSSFCWRQGRSDGSSFPFGTGGLRLSLPGSSAQGSLAPRTLKPKVTDPKTPPQGAVPPPEPRLAEAGTGTATAQPLLPPLSFTLPRPLPPSPPGAEVEEQPPPSGRSRPPGGRGWPLAARAAPRGRAGLSRAWLRSSCGAPAALGASGRRCSLAARPVAHVCLLPAARCDARPRCQKGGPGPGLLPGVASGYSAASQRRPRVAREYRVPAAGRARPFGASGLCAAPGLAVCCRWVGRSPPAVRQGESLVEGSCCGVAGASPARPHVSPGGGRTFSHSSLRRMAFGCCTACGLVLEHPALLVDGGFA